MAEKCEFCGRFGAKKKQYAAIGYTYNGKPYITLYLCPKCENEYLIRAQNAAHATIEKARKGYENQQIDEWRMVK